MPDVCGPCASRIQPWPRALTYGDLDLVKISVAALSAAVAWHNLEQGWAQTAFMIDCSAFGPQLKAFAFLPNPDLESEAELCFATWQR